MIDPKEVMKLAKQHEEKHGMTCVRWIAEDLGLPVGRGVSGAREAANEIKVVLKKNHYTSRHRKHYTTDRKPVSSAKRKGAVCVTLMAMDTSVKEAREAAPVGEVTGASSKAAMEALLARTIEDLDKLTRKDHGVFITGLFAELLRRYPRPKTIKQALALVSSMTNIRLDFYAFKKHHIYPR